MTLTSPNNVQPLPPLTQLLRAYAPENIISFAGFLIGVPTLRSLDYLCATDATVIRGLLELSGDALAAKWRDARSAPEKGWDEWARP